ncbi:MAG: SsrA-binding protein [Candidatus Tyloplasma litorale]|nr:MAG: SsrA-binding protein [Mycoplasmatales bacterium]
MKVYSKNKRAKFDYELMDKYVAGISLLGTEVKSIKSGNSDLTGSYIFIDSNNNAQWINGYIKKYEFQTQGTHEEKRTRQLLLNKKEIKKLKDETQLKRNTIVPYAILGDKKGIIKLEIFVAKGKNKADKRESIKERDSKRESKRYYGY